MIRERGNQRLGFVPLQTFDAGAIVSHDVQALFPGVRMRSNDRMHHRWIAINLLLRGRKGALATSEIEHSTPPFNPALDRFRQCLPRRLRTGKLCVTQSEAM